MSTETDSRIIISRSAFDMLESALTAVSAAVSQLPELPADGHEHALRLVTEGLAQSCHFDQEDHTAITNGTADFDDAVGPEYLQCFADGCGALFRVPDDTEWA